MSNEDKRRIKLDLRRSLDSPDSQFMMILLDPDARKIRDLVDMIKQLSPGMEDSDEVKVYQGKYLLLPDVDIGVIETQKEVIIIHCAKTENVKIKKEYCAPGFLENAFAFVFGERPQPRFEDVRKLRNFELSDAHVHHNFVYTNTREGWFFSPHTEETWFRVLRGFGQFLEGSAMDWQIGDLYDMYNGAR